MVSIADRERVQRSAQRSERAERPSFIKRILPRSLLGRSLLILVAPLVLTQVIATWVFYDRHYDTITRRLTHAIAGEISVLIQMIGSDYQAARDDGSLPRAENRLWLTTAFRPDARLPADDPRPPVGLLDTKLTQALDEALAQRFRIDTDYTDERVLIEVQLAEGVLEVIVTKKRLFSSTTYIFILWMIGSSLVLLAVATVFMRNQVRSIGRLARAADSFGKGRDVPDFKPEGATEVRQAAAAFLKMRARIRRQMQQRTEMLAGVSHDLRTPLTRMKLQLALLGDSPEIDDLSADVGEMQAMIEGYLAFARGEGTEQPTQVDLPGLLIDLVETMRRDGLPIDLAPLPEAVLPLREEATRRCLTNLIGNAQRYAKSRVEVAARSNQAGYEITIDDDGPGIPPELREDVFKPFFRVEPSRNPATGGTGLGLTIARDIARGHGGELTLSTSHLGGLRARLWLPA